LQFLALGVELVKLFPASVRLAHNVISINGRGRNINYAAAAEM